MWVMERAAVRVSGSSDQAVVSKGMGVGTNQLVSDRCAMTRETVIVLVGVSLSMSVGDGERAAVQVLCCWRGEQEERGEEGGQMSGSS
jgi:hypothetical protein